ncbi:MAG: tetratricopeptide repeat protein [Planctomycetota bacterium]|jgi:tetratricopeptide (TPR) repeat protein
MLRKIAALVTLALLFPATAGADVLVLKKRRQTLGISSEINDVKVTPENVELFLEQSKGVIEREGYDGIEFRKTNKARRTTFYPWSAIEKHFYSTEPDALLDGYDQYQLGAFAQAISDFREVTEDPEVRAVFVLEAYYRIGLCYLNTGNVKTAIAHLSRWPPQTANPDDRKSVYTPEVKRLLAEIYTSYKQYITARDQYNQIGALPDLPENWRYRAKLGGVKVDIAERKYDEAERKAKSCIAETGGKGELGDANALAHVLLAEAILQSDSADRLPEAETMLQKAAEIEGVSATNRANLYTTLGHVQYKQGNLDARFAYMRVVLMYPGESGYVAQALLNAGNCFLDMSGRAQAEDQAKSDGYLVKAMKLFAQCAGRHRGREAARAAATAYRTHKKRYDEILAKEEEAEKGAAGKGATGTGGK